MRKRVFSLSTSLRGRSIPDRVAFPLVLLLLSILSFGLLAPRLGFYWDDWAKILAGRLWGLNSYVNYYAEDRPISAWTHILFTPLLRNTPLAWHIFTLLLRWLSAWAMLWSLNLLWPRARWQNAMASALFLVYPVFTQQAAAVTFHQQWLQFLLFFFSLGAMILGVRRRHCGWTALALLAAALQISVTEYFVPVELMRVLMLWFLVGQAGEADEASAHPQLGGKRSARFWVTLRAWAPYAAMVILYGIYRLFIFVPPAGADPYRAETLFAFLASPLQTLREVSLVVLMDEIRILITTWADLLQIQLVEVVVDEVSQATSLALASPFTLLSYALGLAGGGALALYLLFAEDRLEDDCRWRAEAFGLGLLGVLLGPVPAWITGRQVVFDFHSDRYAMPAMFGAALLFAVGIQWLSQRRMQRAVLAGALVALAVGLHLRVSNEYRWIWTDQVRLFWQLHWRAPGLTPQTLLLMENEPFPNQGLFSTSAALNLLYPQPQAGDGAQGERTLAYWMYTLLPRFNDGSVEAGASFNTTFRTLHFEGKAPDSLLLYRDPRFSNCLWVLEPEDVDHPYLSGEVRESLAVSNLARIQPEAAPGYPPADLFGAEPAHGWCYFYEKAALARQMNDWEQGAALYDQAKAAGYAPGQSESKSPYEWLPMIDALREAGRLEEAESLTLEALEADSHYQTMLCRDWDGEVRLRLGCEE